MPNQHSHPWKKEEIEWLKKCYPQTTKEETLKWGRKHKRTYKAIINKACDLGIKKIDKNKALLASKEFGRKIKRANNFPKVKRKFIFSQRKRILICGDNHIPFNDAQAEKFLFNFLKYYKPDIIIQTGDLLDFHQISYFRKIPFSLDDLKDNLKSAEIFFSKIRNLCPKAIIFFIEGNHEFRWRKYLIDNAFAFYKLFSFKLTELLSLEKLKITYIPLKEKANRFSHNFVQINNFYIGHFDKSLKNSAYTGRMLRDDLGANIITGHCHRLGVSYRTYLNDIRIGAETGCLCQLEPAYLSNPDWQQGFSYLILDKEKFYFFPILINGKELIDFP